MPMIGRPLTEFGIVTSPPGPEYWVMVRVPLLVVKTNWACTMAGRANGISMIKRRSFVFMWIVQSQRGCNGPPPLGWHQHTFNRQPVNGFRLRQIDEEPTATGNSPMAIRSIHPECPTRLKF